MTEGTSDERERLANKFTKFYFECVGNGKNGISWNDVSTDRDFTCVPVNKRGIVQIELGDLRTMMQDIADYILADRQALLDRLEAELATHVIEALTTCVQPYRKRGNFYDNWKH